MFAFEASTYINRSPEDVFDFITTPANNPRWQTGVEVFEWTSQPPHGVGSTLKMVASLVGRTVEAAVEITRWDPPNESKSRAIGGPARIEMSVKLSPQGSGTLLVLEVQVELGGTYRLMERMASRQAERQFQSDLVSLKRLLESDRP